MADSIETLRAARQGFPFGELDGDQAGDAFVELIGPHATDDFVCVMSAGGMHSEAPGIEGLRRSWQDFFAGFETIRFSPDGLLDGHDGESMVDLVHLSGRPKGTSSLVEQDAAAVYRLRGAQISRVEFYLDRDLAIERTRPGVGDRRT